MLAFPPVPQGSTSVMARRVEAPDSLDYFPTPPWATRALFVHVLPEIGIRSVESVWEPACGEGHMAKVMAEPSVGAIVTATDVFDYGYGNRFDFLSDDSAYIADWIITNPPFKTAVEFTELALKRARIGTAMLVRLQWIEGKGRYERLFRDMPPTIFAPFVERVPMVKGRWDPDASTATSYAWFVWAKGTKPLAPFWIPPYCRDRLTMESDRRRFAAWSLSPKSAPLLEAE